MTSQNKPCNVQGCGQPRHMTYSRCEKHQRQYWNERDAVKMHKPRQPKGALLEDGTRRKVGKPRKDAPKPISENISQVKPAECVKVLVINRTLDIAQLIEVPVLSSKKWSDVRRPEELLKLLRGSGHVVVYTDRFTS